MKKPAKFAIFLLLAVSAALLMRCHVPYYADMAHARIKHGMQINDVAQVLTDLAVKPTLCEWRRMDDQEYFASTRNGCQAPANLNPSQYKTELTVLFMGPGFLHNDFTVKFDKGGSVSDISELKHWD